MKPALESTSIPAWATAPTRPVADLSGRSWTVVAIGSGVDDLVADWVAQIAACRTDPDIRTHRVDDDAAARQAVDDDLAHALVGWRLMIAGTADACLRLRAHAVRSEVADDEMTVATSDVTMRDVSCVHCRTVTTAAVEVEEVTVCSGCGRNLLVYYHVSRRLGAHLGFMVDAEQAEVPAS